MATAVRGPQADPARAFSTLPLPPMLALCGPETFLVERALGAIRARLGVDADPARGRTVWGDDAAQRLTEAVAVVGTLGLFGSVELLVVRRAEALRGEVEEQVVSAARALVSGHVVLAAAALDRRRKLFQHLPKEALYEFPLVTDRHAVAQWIGVLARERGLRIASDAAAELAERCGGDLFRLAGELDKLALTRATVGVADVRGAVAATRSHRIDELASCLANGDRPGAIRHLRALLAEGEAVPRIVAFVAANVRRSLQATELSAAGLTENEIASRMRMPAWLVRKHRGGSDPLRLARALEALARLDRALKRSRAPDALVEATIAEITTPR